MGNDSVAAGLCGRGEKTERAPKTFVFTSKRLCDAFVSLSEFQTDCNH